MSNQPEFNQKIGTYCLFRIPARGARVIWEITNRCNYRCPYCIFNAAADSNAGELDTERALQLISELKENGFTHLKITGGEPFCRPDLLTLLRHAVDIGLKTDVSTNASLISPDIARQLAEIKLEMVHVSLDGHDRQTQENARGKGTYTPTVQGIKNLVKAGIGYLRIGSLIYKGNENSLEQTARFCRKLGADEVIFSLMEPVGRGKNLQNLKTSQTPRHFKDLLSSFKLDGIKINFSFSEAAPRCQNCRCPGGSKFLFINSGGTVAPCTWIAEKLPEYTYVKNLQQHRLSEVLTDDRFTAAARILEQTGLNCCPAQQPETVHEVSRLNDLLVTPPSTRHRFSVNSPAYLFSTENITGILNTLDISGKTVLTVGASGDHLFNFTLRGARQTDCFDVNLYAKYVIELKRKAIEQFSCQQFVEFCLQGISEPSLYQRLREKLSLPCRFLFDRREQHSFLKPLRLSRQQLIANNPYLQSEQAYRQLRCLLTPETFILSEVQQLSRHLTRTYDLIFLSNIIDYSHLMFEGDYLYQYREKVIRPLLNRLKPQGQLAVGYIYDLKDKHASSHRNCANLREERLRCFYLPGYSYREYDFPSAVENDNRDAILILQKET